MIECMRCGEPFDFEPFRFLCDECLEHDRLVELAENPAKLQQEIKQRDEIQRVREWNRWARSTP